MSMRMLNLTANETEPIAGHSEMNKEDEPELIEPHTKLGGAESEPISTTVLKRKQVK